VSDAWVRGTPRLRPAGDQALVVEIGDRIDEAVNERVHALALALARRQIAGIVDLVPTYRSLLVNYDPLRIAFDALTSAVTEAAASLAPDAVPAPQRVDIPTCYGGQYGPDLPFVAEHNHLAEHEVVAIHASGTYRVFMMGFSPGFAYLGGMSSRIATPRLQTPRTSIPAGSVGIAQQQTGIYPIESPGGWQLIGRTPVRLFDPARTPPTLVEPGDVIRFVAIDEQKYRDLERPTVPADPERGAGPADPERRAGRDDVDRGAGRDDVDRGAGPDDPERRAGLQARRTAGLQPRPTNESAGPVIEIIDAGALTTVQDLGRYGFQRYGVPVSGAMDAFALRIANLLVGNAEDAAALEMTVTGPQIEVLDDTVIALAGADMQPEIDDLPAPTWRALPVAKGAILSFRGLRAGARAYLAIAGGIDVPVVLGSRSTYLRSHFGGFEGRALQPGDRLCRGAAPASIEARSMPASWLPTYVGSHRVRVVPGPQDDLFTARGMQTLVGSAYTIGSQSDRMGYRLEGPRVEHAGAADILSDGTPAGAVQVAGDGMPLVLLADRGTTGGYAKIGTIVSVDLPRLAQSRPGDRIFFDAVSVADAHEALRRQETFFAQIRDGTRIVVDWRLAGAPAIGRPSTAVAARATAASATARAPLPGKIIEVAVGPGDEVTRGQKLCVLEAMKMHNPVCAVCAGRVAAVHVAPGDEVAGGQVLIEIDRPAAPSRKP
jgi:KipI family sensor histidine kinase inhibitor